MGRLSLPCQTQTELSVLYVYEVGGAREVQPRMSFNPSSSTDRLVTDRRPKSTRWLRVSLLHQGRAVITVLAAAGAFVFVAAV